MADLDTFTAEPEDRTVREMANALLSMHRTVVAMLSRVHAAGEEKGWASIAAELDPAVLADLKAVYRAYRTAILTVRPAVAPPDVPGA